MAEAGVAVHTETPTGTSDTKRSRSLWMPLRLSSAKLEPHRVYAQTVYGTVYTKPPHVYGARAKSLLHTALTHRGDRI